MIGGKYIPSLPWPTKCLQTTRRRKKGPSLVEFIPRVNDSVGNWGRAYGSQDADRRFWCLAILPLVASTLAGAKSRRFSSLNKQSRAREHTHATAGVITASWKVNRA